MCEKIPNPAQKKKLTERLVPPRRKLRCTRCSSLVYLGLCGVITPIILYPRLRIYGFPFRMRERVVNAMASCQHLKQQPKPLYTHS